MDKQLLVKIYKQARKDFKSFVGETPEDYKILVFIDPDLHGSLYQIMELGDSPHAVLTREQINNLRKSRIRDFMPDECISVYHSNPTMIYLSLPREIESSTEQEFALRIMLIHAFAHAYFAANSKSNDSQTRTEIYQMDLVIKELLVNNAYGLKDERGIHWGLPYFQDMVAVIRLLTTFGVQEFYIPPETSREASLFQNFLLEIIGYLKKRAELIHKKHLTSILGEAFANYIHREIAQKILDSAEYEFDELPRLLKPLYAPPMTTFSYELLKQAFEEKLDEPKEVIKETLNLQSDLDLIKKFGKGSDVRKLIENLRETTQPQNVYWHADSGGYWRKTWNIYENSWDEIDSYVRFLNKYQCINVGEWLKNSDDFTFYGYIKVDSKPVYVFEIDDESISLEQLLVLHNHSLLYREDFKMPIPGFPDIIMFKKMDRMIVGTLLSIGQVQENPISPWDIPTFTRAVDISKDFLDYAEQKKEQREEQEQTSAIGESLKTKNIQRKNVDYSHLNKMSQSKLSTVKVLIDEVIEQMEGGF
ncbi:MAG: hypothetical protein U9O98_11095 [Asgard group archaeon]|nr:hypothetical protein [Asgard group archaeon]